MTTVPRRGWRNSTALVDSIAILYDYGLTPREVAHRLGCATSTAHSAMSWITHYWGANDWASAASLHVDSLTATEEAA